MWTDVTRPRLWRRWFLWLLWPVAALLVVWTWRQTALADVLAALAHLSAAEVAALVGLNALILTLLNARWWLLVRAQGWPAPFWPLLGYRLSAFAVSYITPGTQFGGEPLQVLGLTRRHAVPAAVATVAVTLDRTLDLLVGLGFLVAALALVVPASLAATPSASAVPLVLGLVLLPIAYLVLVARQRAPLAALLERMPAGRAAAARLAPAVRETEAAIGAFCRQRRGALATALVLSACGFGLMIVEYGLTLRFLGVGISAGDTVAAFAFARLGLLAPTPGGLGAVEAGQVLALRGLGYNAAVAVSLLAIIRLRDALLGLTGLALARRI